MSPLGEGAGTALNPTLLVCAGIATAVATLISFCSIYLHLKNYRKNILQRLVIRIMVMIPLYGISSYISLFSLQAAFFIDAIRDIYEAFVIYVFFQLLIAYLGGERSLLILLHGRLPVHPLFPLNLFKRELDASDPYTYLWLKRGILQYVQVKPILALVTIILKALGKYDEGDLKAGSGYLYISIVYNISISLALYCLAMFWIVVNADLKPYRPMPKFLCVKGILFFSFWQSFFISILVAAGAIKHVGPYTEATYISLAITDLLICLEMPLFAVAHMYAFSHTDYIDRHLQYAARMPIRYAIRDAFGIKDVVEDTKATLHGGGMDYREFEPAEGKIHQGEGRDRRIRAGLRYAEGGRQKYWLPMPDTEIAVEAGAKRGGGNLNAVDRARNRTTGDEDEAYAPLFEEQARAVVRDEDALGSDDEGDGYSLAWSDPDTSEDELYEYSRGHLFGDYNYPCIDVSAETARRAMWEEEERVLRDQRAAYFSPTLNPNLKLPGSKAKGKSGKSGISRGYGATDTGVISVGKGKDTERSNLDFDAEYRDRGNLIDFDSDRMPDMEVDGVRMMWSRKGHLVPRNSPSASASSSGPSPQRNTAKSSSRSTPSRHLSRSRSPSPVAAKRMLPEDAVDLVVGDPKAEEERVMRERLKGDPAAHPHAGGSRALRKVYRRGYKAQDVEGKQAHVEVDEEGGRIEEEEVNNDEEPKEVNVKVAKVDEEEYRQDDKRFLGEPEIVAVADVTVARQATPPPHVHIDYSRYTLDDENPWA